jgi:hypothetical protein
MTMRKCRKPKPRKPPRQEFRPWSGSNMRITIGAHTVLPLALKDFLLKKGETA